MKSILIIDTPTTCEECQFCGRGGVNLERYVCCFTGEHSEEPHLVGCPLKHPLKSVDNDFYIYDRRYLFDNLDREIKLLMSTKRFEEYMKAKGETE